MTGKATSDRCLGAPGESLSLELVRKSEGGGTGTQASDHRDLWARAIGETAVAETLQFKATEQ